MTDSVEGVRISDAARTSTKIKTLSIYSGSLAGAGIWLSESHSDRAITSRMTFMYWNEENLLSGRLGDGIITMEEGFRGLFKMSIFNKNL